MFQNILEIVGKLLFLTWFLWITFTVADLSGKKNRKHLPDPRSPTLRAAVQSEQGGQHLDSSYDEYEGTTFNPKKMSTRPNRSAGG